MKFSEKLQTLRKEKKMSQEQLADLVDVSRQSVSKWESGQAYPEMDKLLILCKIFNCSLDDLTNDEVTEINVNKNSKISASNIVEQLLNVIKECYYKITSMSFEEILKMIIELIILIIVIRIIGWPFDYVASKIGNFFLRSDLNIIKNLGVLIYYIIMAIYFILALIIFGYIFKLRYLDNTSISDKPKDNLQEEKKEETLKKESKTSENKKENIKVVEHKHNLIDFLVNIALLFIKFIVICISFGVICCIIGLSVALAITVIAAINKIVFIGIIIGLIGSIVISISVLEMLFYFVFNHTINIKRTFISCAISLLAIGIGLGTTLWDLTNYEYIDSLPPSIEIIDKQETFTYKDGMYIDYYNYGYGLDSIHFVEDNTINNNSITINYKDNKYQRITLYQNSNIIEVSTDNYVAPKELINEFISNLKDKKIYTYDLYYARRIEVRASKEIIQKLKENHQNIERNNYLTENRNYEIKINNYENTIEKLETENELLEAQLDEITSELNDYKQRISELLN